MNRNAPGRPIISGRMKKVFSLDNPDLTPNQRRFLEKIALWDALQDVLDKYSGRVQTVCRYHVTPEKLLSLTDEEILGWGTVGAKRLAEIKVLVAELRVRMDPLQVLRASLEGVDELLDPEDYLAAARAFINNDYVDHDGMDADERLAFTLEAVDKMRLLIPKIRSIIRGHIGGKASRRIATVFLELKAASERAWTSIHRMDQMEGKST